MNDDEQVVEAAEVVTTELLEDFTHSDATIEEAAPAIARAVLDVARDAGWQADTQQSKGK